MRSNIHSPESGPIVRNRTRSGEIGDVSLIPAKNLINRINFLHFQGHGIQCCFEHAQNGETVFLPLKPAPVLGRNLVLLRPDRLSILTCAKCRISHLLYVISKIYVVFKRYSKVPKYTSKYPF